MNGNNELKVFSGNAHEELARNICAYLKLPVGENEVFRFSNDNIFARFHENIRHRDVFLVQPFASPVNDSIMELLIMIDAAKRASAGRITAVIPYYAYGRTDKKDQPRVPITARLIADLITVSGADRVLTTDLHAGQIQGFFNIPVDELTALPLIGEYLSTQIDNAVVVAPDVGGTKRARDLAEQLGTPLAIIEKRRVGNSDNAESMSVIGSVKDKHAILVDDEIDTGGSLASAAKSLIAHGATDITAAAVHGVLSRLSLERIPDSPISQMIITDSLPVSEEKRNFLSVKSISIAPLLGEAILRIHEGRSVGEIFSQGK
ncbi:MAG: ribose-phosphate pyrophosphokinase [Chloroflexota bacterium]|nr:ribose-phosphate pyrophosphokinase [Chloroflexota bacterium]|tara:strand:- start:21529 stop:22485 length:957 start_codon:yes stop_codon:yes gene_type:complete